MSEHAPTTALDLAPIQSRADHSAALPDVTDVTETPTDCRACHAPLSLLPDCEWPADGPICSTCCDDERQTAIADRAALIAEVKRLRGRVDEWANAVDDIRDAVLNERGPMAGEDYGPERVNAVLSIIDDNTPAHDEPAADIGAGGGAG